MALIRFIPLIGRGKSIRGYTVIDECDMSTCGLCRWSLSRGGYAKGKVNGMYVTLHRLICRPPPGLQVDHINGNKLDNRRANLRACTQSDNHKNLKLNKRNTSGYKGVSYQRAWGKWIAGIKSDGKFFYLGGYDTPELAAAAYDSASKNIHGKFRREVVYGVA